MNLNPVDADKQAIEESFARDFEQHCLEDACGRAPRWVQIKLRSKDYLERWGKVLALLVSKTPSKEMRKMLNTRRLEQAELFRQEKKIHFQNTKTMTQEINEIAGLELREGLSLHEIQIVLMAHLLAESRK